MLKDVYKRQVVLKAEQGIHLVDELYHTLYLVLHPVAYTHLDVYKRQRFALDFLAKARRFVVVQELNGFDRAFGVERHHDGHLAAVAPVSYTHLDVYKRQLYGRGRVRGDLADEGPAR